MMRRQGGSERRAPMEKTRQTKAKLWLCRKDKSQAIIGRHIGRKEIISEAHKGWRQNTQISVWASGTCRLYYINQHNASLSVLRPVVCSDPKLLLFFPVWSSLERQTSAVWDLVKSYIYYIQGWQSRHSRSEAQLCPDLEKTWHLSESLGENRRIKIWEVL